MSDQRNPITITAGEALEPYRLVMFNSSGNHVYADAFDTPDAVTCDRIASGAVGEGRHLNWDGTVTVILNGSCTMNEVLYAADDGKVKTTGLIPVGRAKQTSSGGKIEMIPFGIRNGGTSQVIYSQTADSTAVANNGSEAALDTYATIKAGILKAGDVIRGIIRLGAIGVTSTPTLRVRIRIGAAVLTGTVLLDTSTVTVAASDEGIFRFEIKIRTVGASGTAVAEGTWNLGVPGTATGKHFGKDSFTIDTTGDLLLGATVLWSAASSSNTVLMRDSTVEVLRKAA